MLARNTRSTIKSLFNESLGVALILNQGFSLHGLCAYCNYIKKIIYILVKETVHK
jgi:hypothetical protein